MKHSISCILACAALAAGARTTVSFNDGWSFSRDRKTWTAVDVPHDWAIAGPFNPDADGGTGKLPWKGVGYYRRTFVQEKAPAGRVFLDFDGVMSDATVYVNGQPCGRGPYGYLGFRADITPYLYVGTNEVVVKADTTKLMSRWYPGAGLYRPVRKVVADSLYLEDADLYVTTPEVRRDRATVRVRGQVASRRLADAGTTVRVVLKDPAGTVVGTAAGAVLVPGYGTGSFDLSVSLANPKLWTLEPNAALYTTEVVLEGPQATDSIAVRTGFRFFTFDPEKGFILNGERVQLNGIDLHADLGILGMAFNKSAMRRQLAIMRDMGANALRTSHNPPAPELLDLCDEMGFFVWDEAFDKWNATCGRGDEPLEDFVTRVLDAFVRRDRNRPSVFVWSIGNEIPSGGGFAPGQETWGIPGTIGTTEERCARFRRTVLALDATRPVGIGSCFPNAVGRGDYAALDITGWNYRELYMDMRKRYPGKPLLYSESASAFSDYGFYADRPATNKTEYAVAARSVDSYDHNAAPWSDIPDLEFERMERDLFVGGEFVWTGIDYLGEPSPYTPGMMKKDGLKEADCARSSYFGICDLLGFPKDRTYLYRAHWNRKAFTLHIVPDHWTFPERAGKKMPVYVYTSADEAELFVNGVSQGRRRKDPSASFRNGYYAVLPRYRLIWNDVPYAAGEVKCVAYGKDGKPCGEEVVRTAGAAARVVLAPEAARLPDDPEELLFVKVTLADAAGTPVPRDNRRVAFAVEGPAKIVSVGNANPRGFDSFKAVASHPLYNGRAGLVLRRTGKGPVTLKASADGLAAASVGL